MGTWAVTISMGKEWRDLNRGYVPIYVISELPHDHPLVAAGLKNGDLDAGEQYRHNHFDSLHNVPNLIVSLPTFNLSPVPFHQLLPPDPCTLPTEIRSPHSPNPTPRILSSIWDDQSLPTSLHLPWTSYLLMHPLTKAQAPLKNIEGHLTRSTLTYKLECLQFFFVAPFDGILTVEQARHPFFWACYESEEPMETHYEEFYDKDLHFWWFKRVPEGRLRKAWKLPYVFSYPANNITIHSAFPFPGQSRLLGKVDKASCPDGLMPDQRPRRYLRRRPKDKQRDAALAGTLEPDFEWLPSEGPKGIDHLEDLDTAMTGAFAEEAEELGNPFLDQLTFWEEVIGPDPELFGVVSVDEMKRDLMVQRANLEMQIKRRIFGPVKGNDLRAKSVMPWQPSSTSEAIVWPLRIAGLHGEATPSTLLSALHEHFSVPPRNVLVYCSYQELDTSRTIDIGLRYCEDALWLWCLLHGANADNRLLEVYPLTSMRGRGIMLDASLLSSSGIDDQRENRIDDLLSLRELGPLNGSFAEQLEHMERSLIRSMGTSLSQSRLSYPRKYHTHGYNAHLTLYPVFKRLSFLGENAQNPQIAFSSVQLVLKDEDSASPQKLSYSLATEDIPDFTSIFQHNVVPSQSREVTFRPKSGSQPRHPKAKPYDATPEQPRPRQIISQRPANTQRQDRLVMPSLPPDLEPGKLAPKDAEEERKRTRRGRRHVRTAKEVADPQTAKDMNTLERYQLKVKLKGSARELHNACLFPLPLFNFKPASGDSSERDSKAEGVLELMVSWWDWLDDCRHALDQMQDDSQASDYDWMILGPAFIRLYKMQKLFGQERQICDKALQQRAPWVSKRVPNEEGRYLATLRLQQGKFYLHQFPSGSLNIDILAACQEEPMGKETDDGSHRLLMSNND
jgi:hypothetical protein